MASSSIARESEAMPLVPAAQSRTEDERHASSIPRRLMRVKVLYTFDDQNKSNCLARLPNALDVPTVSLDEATEVGVIELKTCIQAVVAASPELIAKLGHDYTVYAYDYSEYETPLVGQGMLSWILASASSTPNAPAEESQTMVTGRVCKNILGLFSNGIKETLEVKLKLVPVPTCLQREYVENMERYHSLSQLMPEGLDYSAWADFLKSNPTIGQLAQSGPVHQPYLQPNQSRSHPGSEQGLTSTSDQRCASPAMSTASYNPHFAPQNSRRGSEVSIHGDMSAQYQAGATPTSMQMPPDDGPPKKRARVSRASRPKKTAINVKNEPLRVTASTAASVRLHRPSNATAEVMALDQPPRVPTPRPGEKFFPLPPSSLRPPAPSLLRHSSVDEQRPPFASFEGSMFSDAALESADDERGTSPGEMGDTPLDIPSSPPILPTRSPSSAPSSPGLPTLPYPPDSGFVSDLPSLRESNEMDVETQAQIENDSSAMMAPGVYSKRSKSWKEVTPGPVELLPKSYVPKPKAYGGRRLQDFDGMTLQQTKAEELDTSLGSQRDVSTSIEDSLKSGPLHSRELSDLATTFPSFNPPAHGESQERAYHSPYPSFQNTENNDVLPHMPSNGSSVHSQPPSRSLTPNLPNKPSRSAKGRGLPRSHTWSGEPMSDAPAPSEDSSNVPRSGSGAKRRQIISERMRDCIAAGELPPFCKHCGEIETPTWRKAYMRVEQGLPINVELTSAGTGITAFEIIEPTMEDSTPRYRIFKLAVTEEEVREGLFETLTLCNPCGLWLRKQNTMRPAQFWAKRDPNKPKAKRRRAPPKGSRKKSKGEDDDLISDAAIPQSEPNLQFQGDSFAMVDGTIDVQNQQSTHSRTSSFQSYNTEGSQMRDATAVAAFYRAIQSSPIGMRKSTERDNGLGSDLTPKPTRRLLFPSPRRAGEVKSLNDRRSSASPTENRKPGGSIETDFQLPTLETEETDKENCPPSQSHEEDDLAHLFEEAKSARTTPTKKALFQDLLKTPTPGSQQRIALTPKIGVESNADAEFSTPSRRIFTPSRGSKAPSMAPETPFTRQLNALLSDCISSPSQGMDFSAFPAFTLTPNRAIGAALPDFPEDFLSSDLPIPSSPPGELGFSLYEDPATSTVGLWSGASIFEGSDALNMEEHQEQQTMKQNTLTKPIEISVDLAAMIDGVVGTNHRRVLFKDQELINGEDVSRELDESKSQALAQSSSNTDSQDADISSHASPSASKQMLETEKTPSNTIETPRHCTKSPSLPTDKK